jgi:hypothetical protein
MNTKPIKEFIIQSEENLRIAEAVVEAMPAARQKMVDDFLTRLEARLKTKLTGWKFERDKDFFIKNWAKTVFWKPEWRGQYMLALEFADYGKEMVFGVKRDKDNIGDRPLCEELLNAIKQVNSTANFEKWWWEARIPMDSPAADWRRPDILWRMHTDEQFLEDVAEQILEVAKVSEPIVDKLVQKHRK